jgi:hypothetical protein
LRNLPFLRVQVLKRHGCEPASGRAALSVERIRRDGLSGVNRCGTTVVGEVPGVFAVFVKAKTPRSQKTDRTSELPQTLERP